MVTPAFLGAKLADIGLVTIYYFVFGLAVSWGLDRFLGTFDPEDYKKTSLAKLAAEILMHLFILGIIGYFLRNLISEIPSPVEGFGGFEHRLLKEIDGGVVLPFVLLFWQRNLNDKIIYFKERIFPTPNAKA